MRTNQWEQVENEVEIKREYRTNDELFKEVQDFLSDKENIEKIFKKYTDNGATIIYTNDKRIKTYELKVAFKKAIKQLTMSHIWHKIFQNDIEYKIKEKFSNISDDNVHIFYKDAKVEQVGDYCVVYFYLNVLSNKEYSTAISRRLESSLEDLINKVDNYTTICKDNIAFAFKSNFDNIRFNELTDEEEIKEYKKVREAAIKYIESTTNNILPKL